jgi:hypothetical protein
VQLVFSSPVPGGPISDLPGLISADGALKGLRLFDGTDDTLKFFEDEFLQYDVGGARPMRLRIGELDLFRGIPPEESVLEDSKSQLRRGTLDVQITATLAEKVREASWALI